jgi:uncharacterized protein DUF4062
MSETRYQVFVSSTFTDLREERRQVQQALLQMDCIPAGMELFPATDEEQWEFIRKVIEDCDYYIVLIAGRYGSTTTEGISYTEREFDYAVERAIPILAFLHGDPESIPVGQSDLDSTLRSRLGEFRAKVSRDRLVKTWHSAAELAGLVALSLTKLVKTHPAKGWVRGPGNDTTDLLRQINELRQKNEELAAEAQARPVRSKLELPDLALSGEVFKVEGTAKYSFQSSQFDWTASASWDEMLFHLGPELFEWKADAGVSTELAKSLLKAQGKSVYEAHVDHELFKTVRIQFMALGFADVQALNTKTGGTALFWRITERGRARLMQIRTVKHAATGKAAV